MPSHAFLPGQPNWTFPWPLSRLKQTCRRCFEGFTFPPIFNARTEEAGELEHEFPLVTELEDPSPQELLDLKFSWPCLFLHIYHYASGLLLIVTSAKVIANVSLILQTEPNFPRLAKSKSFVSISQRVLFPFHKMGPERNCSSQTFLLFPSWKYIFKWHITRGSELKLNVVTIYFIAIISNLAILWSKI